MKKYYIKATKISDTSEYRIIFFAILNKSLLFLYKSLTSMYKLFFVRHQKQDKSLLVWQF